MFVAFLTGLIRLIGEFLLQTVPPALLGAYAASELAAATGLEFGQAAAWLAAGLATFLMVSAARRA